MPTDNGLYLDFEVDADSSVPARDVLAAALDAAPIASVLIRPRRDAAMRIEEARTLVTLGQKRGVAMLVSGGAAQAAETGADGIHLAWARDVADQLKEARRILAPGSIIGADAGASRHDAMELGEASADYIAFSIGAAAEARAREPVIDLVAWWNEIFELPSVVFGANDAAEAGRLADAGADFVAVAVSQLSGVKDAVVQVRAFADALLPRARVE